MHSFLLPSPVTWIAAIFGLGHPSWDPTTCLLVDSRSSQVDNQDDHLRKRIGG